jgi:hypothetical protein
MLDRGELGADLRPSFIVARILRVASLWTAGEMGEVGIACADIVGVAGVGVSLTMYWW